MVFGALARRSLDHLLRGGVRQRAEGEVEAGLLPVDAFDRDQRRQLERRELRKHRRASPARRCGRRSAARARRADGAAAAAPAPSRCSPRRRARRFSPLADFVRSHGLNPSIDSLQRSSGPPDRGRRGRRFWENAPRPLIRRRRQYQARAGPLVRRRRDRMVTDSVIGRRYSGSPPAVQGQPLCPTRPAEWSAPRRRWRRVLRGHLAEIDLPGHRRLEGAAVAAIALGQRLPDVVVAPGADALFPVRGDVGHLHGTERPLHLVAALAPPVHVVLAALAASARGIPCNAQAWRDRTRASPDRRHLIADGFFRAGDQVVRHRGLVVRRLAPRCAPARPS